MIMTDKNVEKKNKNAEKKAKNFDFMSMFKEAKETAKERAAEIEERRKQNEAEEYKDTQDVENRLKITSIFEVGEERKITTGGIDDVDDEEDNYGLKPTVGKSMIDKPSTSKSVDDSGVNSNEETEDDDDNDESVMSYIPTKYEAIINFGTKPVSAIGLDTQGARMAVGGYDYRINLYEFATMDCALRSKRPDMMPVGCYIINGLPMSGENTLITSGFSQAMIMDSNGTKWTECCKGDQYVMDKRHTKGHCSGLTCGSWHPWDKTEFLTSSDDGTLRIWNLEDHKEVTEHINTQRHVIRLKGHQNRKITPTTCAYSRDAKFIVCGCDDGGLQFWKNGTNFVLPQTWIRQAHGSAVCSIFFSYNNKWMLSRGMDDTMKLWDMANLKLPLLTKNNLDTFYQMTDCCFSPQDNLCATGTSAPKGRGNGKLLILDRKTFDTVQCIEYPDASLIRIVWHPKIHHIFAGLSDGRVICYYGKNSVRGVTGAVKKKAVKQRDNTIVDEFVLAPLTMAMFQPGNQEEAEEKDLTEWRLQKVLREKEWDPNKKFRKPRERPQDGPSAQGRIEEGAGSYHSWILRKQGIARNRELREDDDVRSSILKHHKESEANPQFTNAYKRTQPKPVFQPFTEAPESMRSSNDELEPAHKRSKLIQ